MKTQFSFRAQAADGISPAHLQVRDQIVADQEDAERIAAASEISAISQRGRVLWEQNGAKLTRYGDQIMLKVHSNEPDDRGRLAPILCWGRVTGFDLEDFGNAALAGCDEFAKRIGRTINSDHVALLKQAIRAEKKKHSKRRMIIVLAVIVIVVAIGYGVASQGSSAGNEAKSLHVN